MIRFRLNPCYCTFCIHFPTRCDRNLFVYFENRFALSSSLINSIKHGRLKEHQFNGWLNESSKEFHWHIRNMRINPPTTSLTAPPPTTRNHMGRHFWHFVVVVLIWHLHITYCTLSDNNNNNKHNCPQYCIVVVCISLILFYFCFAVISCLPLLASTQQSTSKNKNTYKKRWNRKTEDKCCPTHNLLHSIRVVFLFIL